jgi:hypothetical protein
MRIEWGPLSPGQYYWLESQIQAQGLIHYKHFSLLRYFGRRLSFRTRILPNFHWLKYFNKLAMYNYWYSTEWTKIYCANLYSVAHAKKGGGGAWKVCIRMSMQYLLYLSQIKVLLKAVKCIIQYILLTALEILNLLIV